MLSWSIKLFVSTIIVFIVAIIMHFLWNALMRVFSGPQLDLSFIILIIAIISVGIEYWSFALPTFPALQKREPSQ